MKNKPLRHKDANTFKFQGFSDRIQNLDIDVYHRVSYFPEDEGETKTYLRRAINKWAFENVNTDVDKILAKLPRTDILEQVLHYKEKIFDVLYENLQSNAATIEAVLEFIVAFARDLEHEFYPFFTRVLDKIISIITESRDPSELEWLMQSVAYLLKYLWKSFLKEPAITIYERMVPLISDKRPSYIQQYAAQCFAYVYRKVAKKPEFVTSILSYIVNEQAFAIEGTGKLFCETVSGVSGTLHSCCEIFMDTWFNHLYEKHSSILFDILIQCFNSLSTKIKPENWKVIWDCLIRALNKECDKHNGKQHIMNLMSHIINLKKGLVVHKTNEIVKTITPYFYDEKNYKYALKVAVALLTNYNVKSMEEHTPYIVTKVIDSLKTNWAQLSEFILGINSSSAFDLIIFTKVLNHINNNYENISITYKENQYCLLSFLSKIILKKSLICEAGQELSEWKKYPLNLNNKLHQLILEKLNNNCDKDTALAFFIIWPHLNNPDYYSEFVDQYLNNLKQEVSEKFEEKSHQFLLYSFICERALLAGFNLNNVSDILQFALLTPDQISSLRLIDMYLTKHQEDITDSFFIELLEKLTNNLCSPSHKVRALSLHILSLKEPEPKLFSHLLETECIPATIDQYRDKLIKLNALDFELQKFSNPIYDVEKIILTFLFGQLYENFKLVWEPTSAVIASYSLTNSFWPIMFTLLNFVNDRIKSGNLVTKLQPLNIDSYQESTHNTMFNTLESEVNNADFLNFRCLLWNTLSVIDVSILNAKISQLCKFYLDFIHAEYNKYSTVDSRTLNLLEIIAEKRSIIEQNSGEKSTSKMETTVEIVKEVLESDIATKDKAKENEKESEEIDTEELNNLDENDTEMEEINDEPMNEEEEVETKSEDEDDESVTEDDAEKEDALAPKYLISTVIAELQVISKLNLPSLKNNEMYELLLTTFYKFMSYRITKVQLLALDCYIKSTPLTSYKTNIQEILNIKSWKSALIKLDVNNENCPVPKEHHDALIKIMSVLLYNKIFSKDRATIMRHFSSSGEEIYITFLSTLFNDYMNDFPRKDKCDLTEITPPRKMTRLLNLVQMSYYQAGTHEVALRHLTNVLINIAQELSEIFNACRKDEVGISGYKSVRKLLIQITTEFFNRGHGSATLQFPFQQNDIDLIFQFIVWPYVNNTRLLQKLFFTWGRNPIYFHLLTKCRDMESKLTPMEVIFNDLNKFGVAKNTINQILILILNLLTLRPDPDSVFVKASDLLPLNEDLITQVMNKTSIPLNFGSKILVPYVTIILPYLQRRTSKANTVKRNLGLNSTEINILARISELITKSEDSQCLLESLIPLCTKKLSGDVNLLTSIYNLLQNCQASKKLMYPILSLFSTAANQNSRELLAKIFSCDKFIDIHPSDEEKSLINDLVFIDRRRLDENDNATRIGAYRKIEEMEKIPSFEFTLSLVYISFYTMYIEESAICKNLAANILRVIGPKLYTWHSEHDNYHLLINKGIIGKLKQGLKNKNEEVINEVLLLVGTFASKCSNLHPSLVDLQGLCNTDQEVDFFENLVHLQIHRRERALLSFASHCEGVKMRDETIIDFIIPIINHYLCSEKHMSSHSFMDSCIKALKMACSQLPWKSYEVILSFYIQRIFRLSNYQKLAVRTISVILDAFHFKLTLNKEKDLDGTVDLKQSQTIRSSILTKYIPKLQNIITPEYTGSHKLSRQDPKEVREYEARETLRVPLALAMVKLLNKLPDATLNQYLGGILSKIIMYLKSKLMSTRKVAREILVEILQTLGNNYFPKIISELLSALTKGYQRHVLIFTIHSLIVHASEMNINTDNVDPCVLQLVTLCCEDLFGSTAEEKGVAKIAGKVVEARSDKSYNVFFLLAKIVSHKCLIDLITPLLNIAKESHDIKTRNCISSCLGHISRGLGSNQNLSVAMLLQFAYGVTSETIPALKVNKPVVENTEKKAPYERVDSRLIEPAPKRSGPSAKRMATNNQYVFVTFGFQTLLSALKRRVKTDAIESSMLIPFLGQLASGLESKHSSIIHVSLDCLALILPIEGLKKEFTKEIKDSSLVEILFKSLENYCGEIVGEQIEIRVSLFKVLSILVKELRHSLTKEQLEILLLQIEMDLGYTDIKRHSSALKLLKSIIDSGIYSKYLKALMKKIIDFALTSSIHTSCEQASEVVIKFFQNWDKPNTKIPEDLLNKIVAQIANDSGTIKKRSINFVRKIVDMKNNEILLNNCFSSIFMYTVPELDSGQEDIKLILIQLLNKINEENKKTLCEMNQTWLKSKKLNVMKSSFEVYTFLIENNATLFSSIKDTVMKDIKQHVKLGEALGFQYSVIKFIIALFKNQDKSLIEENKKFITKAILKSLSFFDINDDSYVQMANKLFGCIFNSTNIDLLAKSFKHSVINTDSFLYFNEDKLERLKTLTYKLVDNMSDSKQLTRNLVFICNLLEKIDDESFNPIWLVKLMRGKVNQEIASKLKPRGTKARKCFLLWAAAVSTAMTDYVKKHHEFLYHLMAPLYRELFIHKVSDINEINDYRNVIKEKVGVQLFGEVMLKLKQKSEEKSASRKQLQAGQAINDPEKTAARKRKKVENKKVAKKRKIDERKGVKRKNFRDKYEDITDDL